MKGGKNRMRRQLVEAQKRVVTQMATKPFRSADPSLSSAQTAIDCRLVEQQVLIVKGLNKKEKVNSG